MRLRLSIQLSLVLVALLSGGCGATKQAKKPPTVAVTVLVRGTAGAADAVRAGLGTPVGVIEPKLTTLPHSPEAPGDDSAIEARLAQARKSYFGTDFAGCLKEVAGETLVLDLLSGGKRATAARVLLWRVACHSGANEGAVAELAARQFAALALEVPADIGSMSLQAETLLGRAVKEASAAKRLPLTVTADVSPAFVSLDGRASVCAAPCSVDVAPGEHVVRLDADGAAPVVKQVRAIPPVAEVHFATSPATPDLAAAQWTVRYGAGSEVDSAASLRLLSIALRAQRLALMTVEQDADRVRLRGVLADKGQIVSRAERAGLSVEGVGDGGRLLLRDLAVRGNVLEDRPLVKRWTFWVALAAGSLIAAGAATAATYQPQTRTEVTF